MTQNMRLSAGGRIDRARSVSFTFDGKAFIGHPGDTVASALIANGVHLFGRSFKYHRPRGLLGSGVEEPNALLNVDRGHGRTEPNQRATMIPLVDGLVLESQNRSPSLQWDWGAVNDWLSPFIPAGFYYKTFLWPKSFWHRVYEPRIRKLAGLGQAPGVPDADGYAHRWAHCETLIIGAGPAGLAAALAASEADRRVILCDEGEELGGSLLSDPGNTIDGLAAWQWLERAKSILHDRHNVVVLPRTTAFAYGIDNLVALAQRLTDHLPPVEAEGPRQRQWFVRAGEVILATGSIERPLVFPNNDRPGIMLASAARTLLNRFRVACGKSAVVVANHDSGYEVALELAAAGVDVIAIVDQRTAAPAEMAENARALGIEVLCEAHPLTTSGRRRITGVSIETPFGQRRFKCDHLLMAGGWTPSVHLFSQSRGAVGWDEAVQGFVPARAVQPQTSVGACKGTFATSECLAEGWVAGGGRRESSAEGRHISVGRLRYAPAAPAPTPRQSLQGLCGFPERCHREGHRACGSRGFHLGRARKALHDQWDGYRSG